MIGAILTRFGRRTIVFKIKRTENNLLSVLCVCTYQDSNLEPTD